MSSPISPHRNACLESVLQILCPFAIIVCTWYVLGTYQNIPGMYLVCTWYVLTSTCQRAVHMCNYSVHTLGIAMHPWICPRLCPRLCPRKSPQVFLVHPSTYHVTLQQNYLHTWYSTVLHQYILCYSKVPPCTALSQYTLQQQQACTSSHYPGGQVNSQPDSVSKGLHFVSLCADLYILSVATGSQNSQDSDQQQVVFTVTQGSTRWYCVLLQHSMYQCSTCDNRVHTCFYIELKTFSNMY